MKKVFLGNPTIESLMCIMCRFMPKMEYSRHILPS